MRKKLLRDPYAKQGGWMGLTCVGRGGEERGASRRQGLSLLLGGRDQREGRIGGIRLKRDDHNL